MDAIDESQIFGEPVELCNDLGELAEAINLELGPDAYAYLDLNSHDANVLVDDVTVVRIVMENGEGDIKVRLAKVSFASVSAEEAESLGKKGAIDLVAKRLDEVEPAVFDATPPNAGNEATWDTWDGSPWPYDDRYGEPTIIAQKASGAVCAIPLDRVIEKRDRERGTFIEKDRGPF